MQFTSWGPMLVVCMLPAWVSSQADLTLNGNHGNTNTGCLDPGNINYGWRDHPYRHSPQKWPVKSTIIYTCESGYTPVGDTVLTCEDGRWIPAMAPQCIIEIDYPPIADAGNDVVLTWPVNYAVLNGNRSSDDKGIRNYYWTLLTSGMNVGLVGTHTPVLHVQNLQIGTYVFNLTVVDNKGQSSWKSVKVQVKAGGCSQPPPIIDNGFYTFLDDWEVASSPNIAQGIKVHYACKYGYKLIGKAQRTCHSGSWTGELPRCVSPTKPVCNMPPQLDHGDYNFLGQSGGDLDNLQLYSGSQAFYFCHDGFQFSDGSQSGSVKLVCQNGRWIGIIPPCEKRTHCDPPPGIQFGNWVFAGTNENAYKYTIGTKILYECHMDYQPFGAVLIECLSTGYWSNFPPKCLMKGMYCEDPGDVLNGYFVCVPNHCGMFKVGVEVHYVCKEGYEPEGMVVSDCLNGGVWSAPKPSCLPVATTPVTASLVDINSNTMTVVIATSCTVLGLLLLVMVVVALQRRKPGNQFCHPVPPPPPPYNCPRPDSVDEHDRVALIAFADGVQVVLPSYEEAVRNNRHASSRSSSESGSSRRGGPGDYRRLPSIPHNLRGPRDSVRSGGSYHSQDHHRNSIITTASTTTRDNLSLAFGSMDTMNASDGTSTSVTIETYDSAASNPSIAASQRATAGSLGSSNASLANEDAPLLTENHNESRSLGSRSQSEQSPIEEEKTD